MPTAARTYVTAGVALVGAGVISATPIVNPQPAPRSTGYAVSLVAAVEGCADGAAGALCNPVTGLPASTPFVATTDSSNVFNIPANLFIALTNTPFNFFNALGDGNVPLGSDPEGDFDFQPTFDGVTLTQPEGSVVGLGENLRYTGSWWVYSPTNILGTDPADPSRYQAITNVLVPFPALSVPLGNMVATIAASQLPMDVGCTGTGPGACDDPNAILSKMFDVRHIVAMFSPEGYTFPTTTAPITCSDEGSCYVKDPDAPEVPWSGQNVKLDPVAPFTSFYDSLTTTPDYSTIKPVTPEVVTGSLSSIGSGINTDFNPFVLGTQCSLCAPFAPNPDDEPVPGPVFEDPDTAGAAVATSTQMLSAPAPAAESLTETAEPLVEEAPTSTAPKHRKPSTVNATVKQVQDTISSSISKVTDSFKKPSAAADSSSSKKDSDAGSGSKKSESDSGSGSD